MHKIRILFLAIFCLLFSGLSFSEKKTLVLGGKTGWDKLKSMDGLAYGNGRFGYRSLELATNSRSIDPDKSAVTDLLLDFEEPDASFADNAGNYSVEEKAFVSSSKVKMGKRAAMSRGNGGITLSGSPDSLFGSSGSKGSFLIEFWLCPSIAENGEIVFSWRSSRMENDYLLYQMISASFFSNHLRWEFINVFNGWKKDNGTVTLSCLRTIIPGVWAHHSISFDDDTGLLEYRIDGKIEALQYITSNGHEHGGSVCTPLLGVKANIEICPKYTGFIDDFRIQRTSESETASSLRYDTYKSNGGRFVTQPILISRGAKLERLDAIVNTPSQTDVAFYVRGGDNRFDWTDDYPKWIPVKNHEQITGVTGQYFQISGDLYPDGGGSRTPSVTEIKLAYTEVPLPLPPFSVFADAGDGEVTLSWSYSVDDQTGGYIVFYGDRPGEYLGQEAYEGASPIDVGNVCRMKFTGLKNGKIYYFAVASYSKSDGKIMGILSKEVYARPLRK